MFAAKKWKLLIRHLISNKYIHRQPAKMNAVYRVITTGVLTNRAMGVLHPKRPLL